MKGQVGNLTSFAYVLMMLAIVMGVGLVVLSQFQTVGTPTQSVTVTNTTNGNNPIVYGEQVTIWIPFTETNYGEFRLGEVSFINTNSSPVPMTQNVTVTVNGNVVGLVNGYNTSATRTFALTSAKLVNGLNNVSYIMGNKSNVSSTSIQFNYTRQQDLQARNTIGSTIDAFSTLVGWLPILVVIVCVAIVLGLLGFGFSTGGKKQKR